MIRDLKHLNLLLVFFILIFSPLLWSQISNFGLQNQFSDTTNVGATVKWLNMRDWYRFNNEDLYFEYSNPIYKFDPKMFYPESVMPKDPFKLDFRSGSYYVPRMVRDELTQMMNRPKDNAFVPILGVAFLAAQLAAKYVIVQQKIKIDAENIINSINYNSILLKLWRRNPQTSTDLYKDQLIKEKFTMRMLEEGINLLIDNKLIKQKIIENDETQYFPALTEGEYMQLIETALDDTTIAVEDRKKLIHLLNWVKSLN